jgi:hypothetical protein
MSSGPGLPRPSSYYALKTRFHSVRRRRRPVALAVAERGHAVLMSDHADIAVVNPALILVHV